MAFRIFTDVRNNTALIGSIFKKDMHLIAKAQSGSITYPVIMIEKVNYSGVRKCRIHLIQASGYF